MQTRVILSQRKDFRSPLLPFTEIVDNNGNLSTTSTIRTTSWSYHCFFHTRVHSVVRRSAQLPGVERREPPLTGCASIIAPTAPLLRTPTQPLGGLRVHRAVLLGPRGRWGAGSVGGWARWLGPWPFWLKLIMRQQIAGGLSVTHSHGPGLPSWPP